MKRSRSRNIKNKEDQHVIQKKKENKERENLHAIKCLIVIDTSCNTRKKNDNKSNDMTKKVVFTT